MQRTLPTHSSQIALATPSLWRHAVAAVMASSLCMQGCAPLSLDQAGASQQVEQPEMRDTSTIVERPVTLVSDQMQPLAYPAYVKLPAPDRLTIGARDRVIWVAGVDPSTSRFQRASERLTSNPVAQRPIAADGVTLRSYTFPLHGEALNARGRTALASFEAQPGDRFYVEFLHAGPLVAGGEARMLKAWRKLLPELRRRGLTGSNLRLGGSRYQRPFDAIVLVQIGD